MDPGQFWPALVGASSTLILAILTFVYVRLTHKLLKNQVEPCVILTVEHDPDRPTMFQLVVKNIGNSVARDISFEFSRPLPVKAFGVETGDGNKAPTLDSGPLHQGIPALGPGETRKIDWGQYGGLIEAVGEKPIIAKCNFKMGNKQLPETENPLDIASFYNTQAHKPLKLRYTESLENMAKGINNFSTGMKSLKISVTSLPEKDDE
jgi:hypothetical protein